MRSLPLASVLTAVLALALCTASVHAQPPASHAKGLSSNTAYQTGDIDHINLFNGNLVVRLPIGQQVPITPTFSYGLSLTYNSNGWDYDERQCNFQGSVRKYAVPIPDRHTNAGFGWQLQLGKLFFPMQEPFNESNFWLYLSPDGATHRFVPQLHPGHPSTPQPETWFTNDGTYLRLRRYPTGSSSCGPSSSSISECLTVEFPDGTVHEFHNFPTTESNWKVTRMRDRFGNFVDVTYPSNPERWRLTDQHGRTQTITFDAAGKVSRVDVAAFGGQTATYTFQYTPQQLRRQNYEPATCSTGPDEGLNVTVDMLSRLVLPDGSFYDLTYFGNGPLSGGIDKVRLPTGGAYGWTYQRIDMLSSREPGEFPDYDWSEAAFGVATKSIYEDANASPIGTWTYDHATVGNPTAPNDSVVPCYHALTVTDPLGHQTVNYFASSQQWNHEYALPFTHCDPHAGGAPYPDAGPFLSQEIYEGTVASGVKKRSVWVRYAAGGKNVNPAPQLRKVVYHDDGDLYRQVENFDFDGLGRYRRTVESGNFDGFQTRTREIDYHLETGTLVREFGGGEAPTSTFAMPSQNTPWVWTTFTEQRVTEGGDTSKTRFCFDRATGFLKRQRTLADASPASHDLLTVFESETVGSRETGQVVRELAYGGDGGQLSTSNNLCGMALPQESYEQRHTYQHGALATSAWIDCDGTEIVKTVDQTIDRNTGMASTSRDSAGVATSFVYDRMGRLTAERPKSGAWNRTDYQLPTVSSPNQPLQITFTQCGNGQSSCGFNQRLAWQQSLYDGLGRLVTEHVQMPDLSPGAIKTSTRHHAYNALGWKLSETSWDSNQKTFFENHDRFGRVGTVRPPGANPATDFTYRGERTTTRRAWIQTSVNGTRTASYSTEMQDTFGRLIGVCENRSAPWSGSCTGGQETYYAYDEADRLTTVCQNWTGSSCGQQRLFTYDNRGFLLAERHPEVGPFGNGWTHYSHDAFGNVLTKDIPGASGFDLAYRYDRAGRLVGMNEVLTPSTSRPLKEFHFARSNSGPNRKAGKLVLAKRYNYVDLLPPLPPRSTSGSIPIVISDAYEYRGRDGRTSKQQLRYQLGVTSYLFNTSYTWDEQGNVDRLTYPECLHDVCSGRAPPRVIDHDYERGYLRRVGSYADAIAYQAGGMLRRVPHGNGVSDWIDLASDGLARPYRMRTEGVANGNWDTGFYVYDGAQNVSNIGPLSFSYDLLSRLTAGDVDAGGTIKRQTATYDAYGNIQQINTGGTVQNPSPNPATNRLAIASYDGAGNVVGTTLGNVDFAYDFDPLNMMKHLRSSEDVSRIFVYNASDERVLTFDCAANVCVNDTAVETWSLRGMGGRVLRELSHPWDGGWSWTRDAVYRDGQLLAYEEPGGVVRHLHLDHLGTPRQITDQNGNEVAYHAYYPFGEEATDPQQDAFSLKFTGHERDENGGGVGRLDYMLARYCSPGLGRFLSVDPIVLKVATRSSQRWNRYSYGMNNPQRYIDPSGKFAELSIDPRKKVISISANIDIWGHEASDDVAFAIESAIEEEWSGQTYVDPETKIEYTIVVDVTVKNLGPDRSEATARNRIQIDSSIDRSTVNTFGRIDSGRWRPDAHPKVFAHEFGHLLGLPDDYSRKTGHPNEGHQNHLMAGGGHYTNWGIAIHEISDVVSNSIYIFNKKGKTKFNVK